MCVDVPVRLISRSLIPDLCLEARKTPVMLSLNKKDSTVRTEEKTTMN